MKKWMKNSIFILLLLIGLGLIFHNQIAAYTLSKFKPNVTRKSIIKNDKDKNDYKWDNVNALTANQILKARINAGEIHFIGYVAIPKIGLNLPISNGVTNTNLSLGAGTLKPGQIMGKGNYALASHFLPGDSYKKLLFSPIYYKGKKGQKIYLTDLKHVYEYKANVYKVIKATDVNVVNNVPGKKIITLITCNYHADDGRILMQGKLEKTMKFKNISTKLKKQLVMDDNRLWGKNK